MNRTRTAFLAFSLCLLLFGCATTQPEQPAANVSAIAGQWRGAIYVGGNVIPATMTIAPNGDFVNRFDQPVGPNRLTETRGTISVDGGKYRFRSATTGSTGTLTATQDASGKRMLRGTGDAGGTSEYTLVK